MKHYQYDSGEKYTPFNHFEMTTQVMFNPDSGSDKMNFTLSTLCKGAGSNDEVHDFSDQIFYMVKGSMKMFSEGKLIAHLNQGDAILVKAGEPHSVINDSDEPCIYNAITAPPLPKTH